MKKFILVLSLFTLAFAACGSPDTGRNINKKALKEEIREIVKDKIDEENEEEEESNQTDNVIVFEDIDYGVQVGGMTVTDIEIYQFTTVDIPDEYNSSITFEGEITIAGNWTHHPDEGMATFRNKICLKDVEHRDVLPIVEGDDRSGVLCFYNQDHAHELFNSEPGDTGYAEFTIDEYMWIGRESEVINEANLVTLL